MYFFACFELKDGEEWKRTILSLFLMARERERERNGKKFQDSFLFDWTANVKLSKIINKINNKKKILLFFFSNVLIKAINMSGITVSSAGVGISNLPNQRQKLATKKGCRYTLMVCGESGLGKTTFINTLFQTTIKEYKSPSSRHTKQLDRTVDIELSRADLEERHFSVQLSVVDTPGFGDYIDNQESWAPVVDFIDEQHESFMLQEQQPSRGNVVDARVHCCLYFIRPTGHG
jgi:ribosome biogenesis GTPase A